MQFLRKLGAVGAASIFLGVQLHAQGINGILPTPQDTPNRQGTRGANFLHIGIGARGGAMAGAIGSTVSGPTAWFWNPAGAASTEGFSIVGGHQKLYEDLDIGQNYLGLAIPLIGGVVGFSLNTLNSGEMLRTTELNPFGERLGGSSFTWTSTAAGIGYAKRLTDRLSVGGQVKYIKEGITDAGTSWVDFNVGTQFNTGLYGLVIGGGIANVGGTSHAQGALLSRSISTSDGSVLRETRRVDIFTLKTEIPVEFRFSMGSDILGSANSLLGLKGGKNTLNAEFTLVDGTDMSTQYAVGTEYGFNNMLFLRGGYKLYNDNRDRGIETNYLGLAGGFGLRLPVAGRNLRFDYSYQNSGALQNIQIFSIEVGR